MKKILFISLAVILALGVGLIGCTGEEEEEEEEITLKIATYFSPTSDQCLMLDAFANDLEADSGGQIDVLRYWGGSLAEGPQLYGAAADNSIDIVFVPLLYSKGAFPEMDIFAQPLGIPSAWVGSHAVQDVWNEYGFSSFNDTHPLFFSMSAPLVIYSRMPLETKDDLSGKLIRTGPPNNCILTSVGATTSSEPMGNVPDLLQKGELDGVMIGCDGYSAWELQFVTTNCTFPYVAGGDVFITTMSLDCWNNKLTPALQTVVTNVAAEYADTVCTMWDDTNKASMEIGEDYGIGFVTLNASARQAWLDDLAGCAPSWVAGMEGSGYADAQTWLDFAEARVAHWIDEQISEGISFLPGYPPS